MISIICTAILYFTWSQKEHILQAQNFATNLIVWIWFYQCILLQNGFDIIYFAYQHNKTNLDEQLQFSFLNKVFYNSTYQMHKFFNKCLLCNKILVPSFDERQESRKEFYYLLFQIKCNKALNYLIWDKTQIICLRGFIIFWLRTFKYNCIWEYKD